MNKTLHDTDVYSEARVRCVSLTAHAAHHPISNPHNKLKRWVMLSTH